MTLLELSLCTGWTVICDTIRVVFMYRMDCCVTLLELSLCTGWTVGSVTLLELSLCTGWTVV